MGDTQGETVSWGDGFIVTGIIHYPHCIPWALADTSTSSPQTPTTPVIWGVAENGVALPWKFRSPCCQQYLPKKQKKQRSEGSRNPARIIEWNSASIELPSNYFIQQTIYIIFISIQSMVSVSTVFKDWSPCGMNLKPCNVSHTVTQSIATDCWNHQYLIVILGH